VSSGDAILGAILNQTWNTRCVIEKYAGKLEGDPNCKDGGVVAFNCSGDQVQCKQALLALEAKCQALDAKNRIYSDADLDTGDPEATSKIWGDGNSLGQLNGNLIQVGGGSDLIPVVQIMGKTVDLNGPVGNLAAVLKMIIIAAAAAAAAFIAGGRN